MACITIALFKNYTEHWEERNGKMPIECGDKQSNSETRTPHATIGPTSPVFTTSQRALHACLGSMQIFNKLHIYKSGVGTVI